MQTAFPWLYKASRLNELYKWVVNKFSPIPEDEEYTLQRTARDDFIDNLMGGETKTPQESAANLISAIKTDQDQIKSSASKVADASIADI